jgi:hypothetical protein
MKFKPMVVVLWMRCLEFFSDYQARSSSIDSIEQGFNAQMQVDRLLKRNSRIERPEDSVKTSGMLRNEEYHSALPLLWRLRGGGRRPVLSRSDLEVIMDKYVKEKSQFKGEEEEDHLNQPVNETAPPATVVAVPFLLNAKDAVRRCKAENRTLLVWVPADAGDAGEASRSMMNSVWSDPEVWVFVRAKECPCASSSSVLARLYVCMRYESGMRD